MGNMAATYPFSLPKLIDLCRQNDVSMVGIFWFHGTRNCEEKKRY